MSKLDRKPREIVDHRRTGDNQIYYSVVWDDGAEEWIQDIHLVGCDKLIEKYFTAASNIEETPFSPEEIPRDQLRTTRQKSKKEVREDKEVKTAQWNISKLKKIRRENKQSKLSKTPAKSKKYEETTLLANKIQELVNSMPKRPPQNKLDYLVDYIEGVFLRNGVPYCSVLTLPPVRTYVVSMPNMQLYFPLTAKQYYENVLQLHRRKLQQEQDVLSEEKDFDSEEDEDDKQQHGKISQQQFSDK